ncbi:TetR/AcrR family transcriptional regulator [Pseudonocardia eucalypti]|uniref:TetR/AcrR family transcriptional regulator n=1 Tax=Pseudonocardia eucalypti TaxID=648755 RepID=A0ABP9QVB4_9PSEU|nr:AcrR family transcriptional regulator [Pseudonocardia eucalypti]
MPSTPGSRRLSRDDWTAEALRALAAGGLSAVAIEPIAARLGATKGSGYWHFKSRDDLISATVARWERENTEAVIARVDDAADRLGELLRVALGPGGQFAAELALLASADHPEVGPVLRRVTRRRLSYLTSLFVELGHPEPEADRRALQAYTTYLGHAQLTRTDPDSLPGDGPARAAYLDSVLAVLTATSE